MINFLRLAQATKYSALAFSALISLSYFSCGALAAEDSKDKKTPEAKNTPITAYEEEAQKLLESLNEEQAKKYQMIRNTHGIIRAVQSVEKLVDKAVSSCKKEHDELGKTMEERFNKWQLAVHPVVKSGEDRLEKLVLLQDYAKPSEVKAHLKNFDDAANYGESLIDQKPATDEKSCKKLLNSMDATQGDLIRLMRENIGIE